MLHPCFTPVLMSNHLVYFSLVFYRTLEVSIEYFYHSNDLFWDSVFVHVRPHAFAVVIVERLFKIYEVQIECCLPLVNLFNHVPQYKYLFVRPPCLFYILPVLSLT